MPEKLKHVDPTAAIADPAACRATMARVLASDEFTRTPRLSALLRFLVEETLAGRGERLKAFVIAQAVYDRDESFDATNDTIVRVEAGRLRRNLERYYLTDGAEDGLRLEIPKGAYRVLFSTPPRQETTASEEAFLAILPLETASEDRLEQRLARGLVEALITHLTQLSNLRVMAHSSVIGLDGQQADFSRLKNLGATHVLTGYLAQHDDIVSVTQHLVSLESGATIWSLRRDMNAASPLALEREFALQVAQGLAAKILPGTEDRELGTLDPAVLVRFREGMLALSPPSETDRLITARNIFQRLIESDPEFPGGHAGLAFLLSVGSSDAALGDRKELLETAEQAAQRCLALDPNYAFGHTALAVYCALTGQRERARQAAAKAIALAPGEAMTLFGAGFAYVNAGRPDLAIEPMEEALRLDPIEPRTPYMNTLGITYLSCGRPERSIELFERGRARGGPEPESLDLFCAIAHVQLGQERAARLYLERLPQPAPWATGVIRYALPDGHEAMLARLVELGLKP